ncbi:serine/threonine-protein kinase pim-2-like [Danio rerio]|uniref:Serine/threonine-protein kinase pim-2-like n=14 Tax=Danio rerio TaxID=7955 RepID=A0AC58HKF8_DANRE
MEKSMLHVPGPSGQRRPPCRQRIGPSPGSVEAKYDLKENIGAGCYGNVYRGIRKMDGKQFIIKSTTSEVDSNVPGYPLPIPIEVAMMTIVRDPPSPLLIKLQEWFLVKVEKLPRGKVCKTIMLVMEYLGPCRTLEDFLQKHQHLEERVARTLILQIVKAAQECLRRKICHHDIHDCNILVIDRPLQIKLIDFGCGMHICHDPKKYPPDTRISPKKAVKNTVKQLFGIMREIEKQCSSIPEEFMAFMNTCITLGDDDQRLQTVQQILDQPWLKNQ